jgi:N-acetyl-beta-hexosaminidase
MDEIRLITNYAIDRGITSIFEIDVPGHAASWVSFN